MPSLGLRVRSQQLTWSVEDSDVATAVHWPCSSPDIHWRWTPNSSVISVGGVTDKLNVLITKPLIMLKLIPQGRTSYLSIGYMSKHMLIGGINALPYSSHMPTVHIWNLIHISSKMQISLDS